MAGMPRIRVKLVRLSEGGAQVEVSILGRRRQVLHQGPAVWIPKGEAIEAEFPLYVMGPNREQVDGNVIISVPTAKIGFKGVEP